MRHVSDARASSADTSFSYEDRSVRGAGIVRTFLRDARSPLNEAAPDRPVRLVNQLIPEWFVKDMRFPADMRSFISARGSVTQLFNVTWGSLLPLTVPIEFTVFVEIRPR